jgi:CRP-like cAMP-binding protein
VARKGSKEEKIELLQKVSFFSALNKKELDRLASRTDEVRAESGTVLTEEGKPGDEFFVVAEGMASVSVGRKKVGSIKPGDFFGEMALLDQGPRSATVKAELPVRLLKLDAKSFADLVSETPAVALKIMRGLAERLRTADEAIRR